MYFSYDYDDIKDLIKHLPYDKMNIIDISEIEQNIKRSYYIKLGQFIGDVQKQLEEQKLQKIITNSWNENEIKDLELFMAKEMPNLRKKIRSRLVE